MQPYPPQRTTRKALLAAAIAAATAATGAPPAFAQNALEEVIVTARKREENLQLVPAAINVLTASALQDRQVANIVDIERTSPNVTMTETGGAQAGALQVFMRGIGNDNGFDPGIGIYIDDVFVQRPQGALLELYDVERIEVLKGPQGNLYGRNTIGGAIKYITKDPDENFAAQVEGKVGSYNLRQVKGSASGPLVDGLLYGGFGLMYKERDGIQENVYDGADLWDVDMHGLRGTLKLTPREDLTVKVGVDYMSDNSMPRIPKLVAANRAWLDTIYGAAVGTGNLPPTAPPPDYSAIDLGEDKVKSEADYSPYRLRTFTANLTLEWEINDEWAFKSVTAQRTGDQTFVGEFDGSAITYLSNIQYSNTDDLSQEFQFTYSGDRLDAVMGAFYIDGRQRTPSFGTITPYVFVVQTRVTDTYKANTDLESWSLYGNMDYAITEALKVSLGARLTSDKKTFEQLSNVDFIPAGGLNGNDPIGEMFGLPPIGNSGPDNFGPESETWRNFSPSFKLAYEFNEDTMGYLSVSTGFKAGGFNPYPNGSPSKIYDPEKVRTYAAGLKTTLLEGRLRLNTEVFYNDYSDKQLQYLSTVDNNITTLFTNAGKVSTRGVETEISWLTPVDGLEFGVNIGYLDARVEKFDKLVNGVNVDQAWRTELGFSPRWTVQPRISYTTGIADAGELLLAADASYRTQSYTNSPIDTADPTGLSQEQSQPEHVIFNAIAVFTTADGHWRFALEGRNLTDERVLTNTFNLELDGPTFIMGSYNDPRTWAMSASYTY